MGMTRDALMRYLDSRYRQEMMPARVVGSANGVVTVEVNGETQVMNHHGVEDLVPGTLIWTRPNTQGATNPVGRLEYAGPRNQGGTINDITPTTVLGVSEESLAQYLDPILARLDALEALFPGHEIWDAAGAMPQRNILKFQGTGVSVSDDALNDTTVVTISGGGGGGGTGSYNDPLNYNEPQGYNG